MFFRVENLGPLREAEVDLSKDLILLTGPNNTGKTYVAWSVYGLFRNPFAPEVFRSLADEILASPNHEVGFHRIVEIWPSLLDGTAERFASRLHLCFAAQQQSFANVNVSLRPGPGEPEASALSMRSATYGFLVSVDIAERLAIQFYRLKDPIAFTQIPPAAQQAIHRDLGRLLARPVMAACWPSCAILTTDRTAVDMFARELSNLRTRLFDTAIEAKLDPNADPLTQELVERYPWPIQDGLETADDLAFISRSESEFADLAIELETLLRGAVSVSSEGAIGFTPAGTSLSLGTHLTSSVVKSLASLVFFFRHRARKGNLLMIDEPELNLHPDNQRKVARVLAKAVNRGLKLMMSTHSDYVLRELNNLILLNRDTEPVKEVRARHGYTESELLSPAKVGVYLFKDGVAESVPVTEDGFEVRTIEEEINRMNAVSQEIYAALHE